MLKKMTRDKLELKCKTICKGCYPEVHMKVCSEYSPLSVREFEAWVQTYALQEAFVYRYYTELKDIHQQLFTQGKINPIQLQSEFPSEITREVYIDVIKTGFAIIRYNLYTMMSDLKGLQAL